MRATIGLLTMLLLVLPGCGDAGPPTGQHDPDAGPTTPAAHGESGTPGPRLLLCQELMSPLLGGPPVRHLFVLLLPDGTAVWGLPPGGVDAPDLAALRASAPEDLGTWKTEGNGLAIHWPRKDPVRRNWTMKPEKSGWRRNVNQLYEPVAPATHEAVIGSWISERSASSGSTVVAHEARLVLGEDGRFERGARSGVASDMADGSRESADRGTWTIEGFTLMLRPEGGGEERHVVYGWPGDPADLGIDRRRYTRP